MTEETYKQYKADCEALQKQIEKVLAYTRHDTLAGFATKPKDLEKMIFLDSDGDTSATVMDFVSMHNTCARQASSIAIVVDSEGELVAFAPKEIARLIAKLLDESNEVADNVFI